jgi:hypothetical protein
VTSPFGDILKQAIAAREWTQRHFASEAQVSQGFVGQVIAGTSRLPPERVEPWADLLGLKGEARRRFVIMGHLTQTPRFVQLEVARLLR